MDVGRRERYREVQGNKQINTSRQIGEYKIDSKQVWEMDKYKQIQ